jgi:poly(A) polymerase
MKKKHNSKLQLFIIGGWVRDKLLGKKNPDLDFIVFGDPLQAASKIADSLKGKVVRLDDKNGIYRVIIKDNPDIKYIDFAAAKGKDIFSDLSKRDFTINSIAVPLTDMSCFIDPFKGLNDLRNKTVRMTSPEAFKDDPLRILRAFRFSAQLGFKIEKTTLKQISRDFKLVTKPAGERVRDELFKILTTDDSCIHISELDNFNILSRIIPEIEKMKKSARNFYFHPKGLWQHSIETLSGLEEIIKTNDKIFGDNSKRVRDHLNEPLSGGVTRLTLLKLVALLHDIAKPGCARRVEGKMRFLGHEAKGAKIAEKILLRLKLSRREISIAKQLIELHMRPISLGQSNVVTERAIYRLFRDVDNNVIDLMVLTLSDCYSYRRLKTKKSVELKKLKIMAKTIVDKYFRSLENKNKPRIIDGNLLMKHFKLKSGPLIGELLRIANEALAVGEIATKKEALGLCSNKLTRLKKKYRIK